MHFVRDVFGGSKDRMIDRGAALPGRPDPIRVDAPHHVNGHPLSPPYPPGSEIAYFGMGCFWGAERRFWEAPGIFVTAVGYQGGYTPNPTYEEVCSGRTGHAEEVMVVFDPARVSYEALLSVFWESHDPTQGMRQGNDRGTQYRSTIYTTTPAQADAARASRAAFGARLHEAGFGEITTEIRAVEEAGPFYFAEGYHQQYLSKNPFGYCGLGGTGVSCPVGAEGLEPPTPSL